MLLEKYKLRHSGIWGKIVSNHSKRIRNSISRDDILKLFLLSGEKSLHSPVDAELKSSICDVYVEARSQLLSSCFSGHSYIWQNIEVLFHVLSILPPETPSIATPKTSRPQSNFS
jgi:hypothetical protein